LTSVDVLNTVTLVAEAARVCETHPAAVLALVDIPGRTESPLTVSGLDNERVVLEGFLGSKILGSMDSTADVFERLPDREHSLNG
jgi:hypothetical protein